MSTPGIRTKIKSLVFKNRPYLYARYFYWKRTGRFLSYINPKGFDQKLFWYNRYWQHPLIVRCADKVAVRDYIKECGLECILTRLYGVYDNAEDIDFTVFPDKFVLKANNHGAGRYVNICKDKRSFDCEAARENVACGLVSEVGLNVADYQYQFIRPRILCEELIEPSHSGGDKLEIQFFCINGKARHILVRNDLGDAALNSFAISYDMDWNRVQDRKNEDMSIDIAKPERFGEMVAIAERLAAPFPHVRVDFYYIEGRIVFGELTFTTAGKILSNYIDSTVRKWGDEWILPPKLNEKWSDYYGSHL